STLADGEYKLLVTATDLLGNPATPYQVTFKVQSANEINSLTVYPNPAADHVSFTFRLTGSQAPDQASISIYDLNGRVVRQLITDQNQRTLRIGQNDWLWDGRSTTGELLPPGIYLYKLQVGRDAAAWPMGTNTRKQLTGRVVLMR
ncbi:MAG TPA: FlgD immunoglobulin-like domain containing protein, partial [Fibrella sp.]